MTYTVAKPHTIDNALCFYHKKIEALLKRSKHTSIKRVTHKIRANSLRLPTRSGNKFFTCMSVQRPRKVTTTLSETLTGIAVFYLPYSAESPMHSYTSISHQSKYRPRHHTTMLYTRVRGARLWGRCISKCLLTVRRTTQRRIQSGNLRQRSATCNKFCK